MMKMHIILQLITTNYYTYTKDPVAQAPPGVSSGRCKGEEHPKSDDEAGDKDRQLVRQVGQEE